MKRGSPRTAVSNARRAAVFASAASTGRAPDDPPAPEDVVGDDEGTGRQPRRDVLEVRVVLRLQGVDEGEVERARPGPGSPASNASSAGAFTTVIRSSAMPASRHQPRARSVRERSGSMVTIVPSARLPERHPQRRVAVRRPDLDDPPPAAGQHREHAAAVAVDDRDARAAAAASIAARAGHRRRRAATRSSRDRRLPGSTIDRPCPSHPPRHQTRRPAPK